MLAEVVPVQKGLRHALRIRAQRERVHGHAGHGLQHNGIVHGVVRRPAPGEGAVPGDEDVLAKFKNGTYTGFLIEGARVVHEEVAD